MALWTETGVFYVNGFACYVFIVRIVNNYLEKEL